MDLRYESPLAQMNICEVAPLLSDLDVENARLLDPGVPEKSIIMERMKRFDVFQMPPIGRNFLDAEGILLIESWIRSMAGCL